MTTIRSLYKRPAVFRLPDLKKRKAPVNIPSGNEYSQASSERRVLDNTDCLRALYAFLRESKARVP